MNLALNELPSRRIVRYVGLQVSSQSNGFRTSDIVEGILRIEPRSQRPRDVYVRGTETFRRNALTILNTLATALLAYRIWKVDHEMKGAMTDRVMTVMHNNSALNPVVRIILESGVINAAYLLVYVLTLEYGTEGIEIMSELVSISLLSPRSRIAS